MVLQGQSPGRPWHLRDRRPRLVRRRQSGCCGLGSLEGQSSSVTLRIGEGSGRVGAAALGSECRIASGPAVVRWTLTLGLGDAGGSGGISTEPGGRKLRLVALVRVAGLQTHVCDSC
ncbi:hypothetical protein NDU88_003668 [Pleurodeles waltl]|uniref:Uncharacterized protein n=1 Tax=Pleurodeles waltl TaxID=8319 RepID=A0AAV7UD80_PLEWA|nr:hypothetical protein NDU88_003668 [Pleurodeles waltl]